MAVLVLTDADITVNGVVLSDRANSVTLNYEIDSDNGVRFSRAQVHWWLAKQFVRY